MTVHPHSHATVDEDVLYAYQGIAHHAKHFVDTSDLGHKMNVLLQRLDEALTTAAHHYAEDPLHHLDMEARRPSR